ncbi:hypothetical protein Psyaliredsea_31290 [Psychrobacter alimentarius]
MAAARIDNSPRLSHLKVPNRRINMASFALLYFQAVFKITISDEQSVYRLIKGLHNLINLYVYF